MMMRSPGLGSVAHAHRVGPKPGQLWREVRPTYGRRHRRIVYVIAVTPTHARVRNVSTNYPSRIRLARFTHGILTGWRRYHFTHDEVETRLRRTREHLHEATAVRFTEGGPLEDDDYELTTTFEGNCTCEHVTDEHGWGSCAVDACTCEAGWVE